jgi:hypothetical protein
MSIMIALEMGLLEPIVERKGQPITSEELAKATGSDKLLTGMLPSGCVNRRYGRGSLHCRYFN